MYDFPSKKREENFPLIRLLKYIQPQIRSRNGKITGKPQRTTYTVESPEKNK